MANYAHRAVLLLDPGSDERAPGAAITTALCGSWEHEPPCPFAHHRTDVHRVGDELHLRVAFDTDPGREQEVRDLLRAALARGQAPTPEGATATWRLRDDAPC